MDQEKNVVASSEGEQISLQDEKLEEGKKTGYVEWIKKSDNTYIPSEKVVIVPRVEAGLYSIRYAERLGYYLFKEGYKSDEILQLPTDNVKKVIDEIKDFWGKGKVFRDYGLAHKRGILLYGEAGNGKSSVINLVIKDLIEVQDGIVLKISSKNDLQNYGTFMPEYFKSIEPDRPIVVIIEDLDGLVKYNSETETLLLNILDGLEQMEKTIYMATTNYPEDLKARLLNRPSRFDIRIEIARPTPEVRKFFFMKKLKPWDIKSEDYPDAHDIDQWVKLSEGLTMAHLKEMIISIVVLGNTLEYTMDKIDELKKRPNSADFGKETNQISFIKSGSKTISNY